MKVPIVLVTRMTAAEEARWRDALASAMPDEAIVPLRDLPPQARSAPEIAIVADPDPAALGELTALRWIQSLWAGVERLVATLPDAVPIARLVDPELARTMGEAVVAWCHYLQRDMPAYASQQRARLWRPRPYRAPADLRVGILGVGALGTAAARRCLDAGFPVTGWRRTPGGSAGGFETLVGDGQLDALLDRTDILVSLLPLTPQTTGLLDRRRLSRLPAGAALVNFSRGPVVVADDLVGLLDAGHLSHAVLDVFDAEPLPEASPLWEHPGLTILPHVSAPTNRASAARIVARSVRRYRETGALPATVDRRRGY